MNNVLLILKVEVHSRSMTEDPHQQPLAYPVLESYVVQSVEHDRSQGFVYDISQLLHIAQPHSIHHIQSAIPNVSQQEQVISHLHTTRVLNLLIANASGCWTGV